MLMEVRTVKSVSLVSSETEGCPCPHPPGDSNSAKLKTNASRKRSARKLLQDCGTMGLRVVYEVAIREVKRESSVVSQFHSSTDASLMPGVEESPQNRSATLLITDN